MCGRFAITTPSDAMAQLFSGQPSNDLPNVPNYNVCPTNPVHVVQCGENGRRLVSMRWGFLPHWYGSPSNGPLLINARAETLAQKPAFAEACRQRRCLVPASGFFEWTKADDGSRQPWYFQRRDGGILAFGAIWQSWGGETEAIQTCAIVTTAANAHVAAIHHRMPLVLEPDVWAKWLGEEGHGAASLMQPAAEDMLCYHPVDPQVNSNRAEGEALIEPFHAADTPPGRLL
ncbi:SOS response-associated peptidase [Leisingera sp. XS_AS12]|uniref:SOS response-associated peptidase n=1 Tax=Leisingera sp. XS_AS12 TaxID=3241294 RepID=UPI00351845C4